MYQKITDEDPYKVPMRIYPAIHYTMGGLWVDYNLMSNDPGLHVLGEANFSDHGANRLGASALMQGLADGYFVIPYTIGDYLGEQPLPKVTTDHDGVQGRGGQRAAPDRHGCCRSRAAAASARSTASSAGSCGTTSAWRGPRQACAARSSEIPKLRDEFWHNVSVPGSRRQPQSEPRVRRPRRRLPRVRRAAGASTRSHRRESCGGHFREESQTPDGEALRDDEHYSYVAAWEFKGVGEQPELHKEPLEFEEVHPTQRSYK